MSDADLKRFPLLAEFGDADREALLELLEERETSQGVALFREGSEAEGLVLLVKGTARLESQRGGVTATLGPGTSIGALSAVVVGPREASLIAETACTYLVFPRTAYHRLAEDYPRTACRLSESILEEFASVLREGLDKIATCE